MFIRLLTLFCISLNFFSFSQEGYSKKQLLKLLTEAKQDTTLVDIYNELAWPIYSYDIPDSSIFYGEKAITLATQLNDVKRLSISHRRLGITYSNIGDIQKSIEHQQLSYELSEKIGYKRGMQLALNNLGVAYLNNQILNKALTYFLKSLQLAEESKNYSGLEHVYYNCALIYRHSNDIKKSKEYLLKSIRISLTKKDSSLLLVLYSGMSVNCRIISEIDSAFYYTTEAKRYLTANSNTTSKFDYYLNEGLLLSYNNEHKKALALFLYSKSYATVANDEITVLINIAEEYLKLNDKLNALSNFRMAYDISYRVKTYNNLAYLSLAIANIYESLNKLNKYSEFIKLHLSYKDSNDKYIKVQQIQQQQLEFDYERKVVADSLRYVHRENLKNIELEIADAKLNKEKIFRIMLLLLLLSILLFSLFIFNRLKITRKQKRIIEKQKQLVEIKNQEILDSINYAKRLQTAILPQLSDIQKDFRMDLLYLPKDIIGGDFYFYEKNRGITFFAICDCTGHGIPGALMSVVCHNALHKAIHEFKLLDPSVILNKTRQLVIDSLNATQQKINDGMDCTLIAYNESTKSLTWSGAYNNLWLIANNTLIELKADKQPVAYYDNEKDFQTQIVPIESPTTLYLLSDGYSDQFGGPQGKKYKNSTLKKYLVNIYQESESTQIKLLKKNIHDWQGDLDQVDDITIAVIKF